MRTFVAECLLRQILVAFDALAEAVAGIGGGGGGGGATKITGPDVTSYTDARGVVGDWSYDPLTQTMWQKVDTTPDAWVSWSVADTI